MNVSYAWFLLPLLICWQPLYLLVKVVYHLIKRDTWDATGYWQAFLAWFKQLLSLIFAKPNV